MRQDLHALAGHYVWLARRLGSSALDLPAGSQDDYLRLPSGGKPRRLGHTTAARASAVRPVRGTGATSSRDARGYFHALWCIVVRREMMNAIGAFPEHRSSCNDLEFRHRTRAALPPTCWRYPLLLLFPETGLAPRSSHAARPTPPSRAITPRSLQVTCVATEGDAEARRSPPVAWRPPRQRLERGRPLSQALSVAAATRAAWSADAGCSRRG